MQTVLNAIVSYLPTRWRSPIEGIDLESGDAVVRELTSDQPFAGLVFETISDPNGDLTFMRLYTGEMKQGEYYNGRTRRERIGRLMHMHAIQREPLGVAKAGDIVAVVGVEAITGDAVDQGPRSSAGDDLPRDGHQHGDRAAVGGRPRQAVAVIGKLVREDPTFRPCPTSRPARWSSPAWVSSTSRGSATRSRTTTRSASTSASRRSPTR